MADDRSQLAPAAYLLPAISVVAPLAAPFIWQHSPAAALGAMAASHLAFSYAGVRANCQWCGPVATRFIPNGDEVWLTVDDGPHPEDTPRLLDLLDGAGARATFFVRGDRAERHPELVREIVRRGHTVGNHTHTHPQYSFWCVSPRRAAVEMDRCGELLRGLIGLSPRLFRAPVGMANPFVHMAAHARGLRLIGWSERGFDTGASAGAPTVVKRVLRSLQPGGIILLHEGHRNAAGEPVGVHAARMLLAELSQRRWRIIVPDDARIC